MSLLELYAYANLRTKRYVPQNRPGYVQTPELLGKITGDFLEAKSSGMRGSIPITRCG